MGLVEFVPAAEQRVISGVGNGGDVSGRKTTMSTGADIMRIAVVGFGYWGPNHARVCSRTDGVQTIIVDPDEHQLARAAEQFPELERYRSLAEVGGQLDGVILCSPPATHLALAREAFSLGAHVLVEKPLAPSFDDAAKIIELAKAAKRTVMVGHIYDFHAATGWLEQTATQGGFGAIQYIDAARLAVGGYRSDVNVMWDMAPHDLCLMRRVMGGWPSAVTAWAVDHSGHGVADLAHMRLEFHDSRAVGYIRVSWLDPAKVRRFTIVGDRYMAVFNDAGDPTRPFQLTETGATTSLGAGARHPVPGAYPDELISYPQIEPIEPLKAEIDHFLDCIRTGSEPQRASGQDGLEVVRVLEAADRSARTGERVVLSAEDQPLGAAT